MRGKPKKCPFYPHNVPLTVVTLLGMKPLKQWSRTYGETRSPEFPMTKKVLINCNPKFCWSWPPYNCRDDPWRHRVCLPRWTLCYTLPSLQKNRHNSFREFQSSSQGRTGQPEEYSVGFDLTPDINPFIHRGVLSLSCESVLLLGHPFVPWGTMLVPPLT